MPRSLRLLWIILLALAACQPQKGPAAGPVRTQAPALLATGTDRRPALTATPSSPAATSWTPATVPPSGLRGYAYSPFRDCQMPGGVTPTQAEMDADLAALKGNANAIRTYTALYPGSYAAQGAYQLSMKIALGVQLGKNETRNEEEIDAAVELAKKVQPEFVIAGNEVILTRVMDPTSLSWIIMRLQKAARRPVAFADVTTSLARWNRAGRLERIPEMERVYQAADILLAHIYPFWDGVPIEQAAWYTVDVYRQLQALFPDKRVIIGETGWPSRGPANGQALPSAENQRKYFLEFTALADQEGIDYFFFSPFDEPWKVREAGEIGQSWGLSTTDREQKFETLSLLERRPAPPRLAAPAFIPQATGTGPAVTAAPAGAPPAPAAFNVYDEFPSPPDAFAPSQMMGDLKTLTYTTCDKSQPYQGRYAMRVSYQPAPGGKGWAGVAWLALDPQAEPADIRLRRPIDLSPFQSLRFYARGEQGGEKISVIWRGSKNTPLGLSQIAEVQLTPEWRLYQFDLRGVDLSAVEEGLSVAASRCKNPQGAKFYLDEVAYSREIVESARPATLPILQDGCLSAGYDLDVDSSEQERTWLSAEGDTLKLSYPPGQSWGVVYVHVNPEVAGGPQSPASAQFTFDYSQPYKTLEIEMRGETGREQVWVGIKRSDAPDDGTEPQRRLALATGWQTYRIPLQTLLAGRSDYDLNALALYIPAEFVFKLVPGPTVIYVRNIHFAQ